MADKLEVAFTITEEDLAEHFYEILEQLHEQHQSALISRDGEVMARLVPVYGNDAVADEG